MAMLPDTKSKAPTVGSSRLPAKPAAPVKNPVVPTKNPAYKAPTKNPVAKPPAAKPLVPAKPLAAKPAAGLGPFNRGQMPLAEGDRFASRPSSMLPVSSWGGQPPPPVKPPSLMNRAQTGAQNLATGVERTGTNFMQQFLRGLLEMGEEGPSEVNPFKR